MPWTLIRGRLITALLLTLLTATPAFSDLYNTAGNGGTTTNDNACAGCIGEFIGSTIAFGSAVPLTTVTPTTVTSITLTPGDWDVWAVGAFTGAATTTVTYLMASTNTTNAINIAPQRTNMNFNNNAIFASPNETDLPVTQSRYSIASSTTINLVVQASFGTSTCSAFGGVYARRRR